MARLLKVEELYNYTVEDYVLWIENMTNGYIIPFCINSPADRIYSFLAEGASGERYIAFSGVWLSVSEYGKTWRCWVGKPTQEEMNKE